MKRKTNNSVVVRTKRFSTLFSITNNPTTKNKLKTSHHIAYLKHTQTRENM